MSDTAPRNPGAPQLLADALLRCAGGTSALLRVTAAPNANTAAELGLAPTSVAEVVLSPVAMRKLRPSSQRSEPQWELLVSATSVQRQVNTLEIASAQSLFSMTMAISIAGQDYLLESVATNEAFGQIYLYRLVLREASRHRE